MEPNKSQIPSLKDTKKPELRVKGLAVGMSLVDRVKSFRKKDLAFIGAGLAVLFLAPLVEHFLMAPESGQPGAFKEGWTFGRGDAGSGSFGKGGSPYEPGVTGLAPGGLLGMGSEIITPLNVRDPASLVMGPGQSSAQPVTAAPAAASASAAKPASDWKDALAAAAGAATKGPIKAASLPVPKVPLQGGLRGLGVLGGGGSGASWSGGGVGPAAGSSKPAGSSSLTNIKTPTGFKGVAGKRGNSPAGSIEDLKKAGDKAAEGYNRGGGAGGNLLTSAEGSQAIPGGGSSGGAGGSAGTGADDKAGGANKDMRSNARGEQSLAYQIAKENAMRQLDLDWEKKKKKEMFWPDLQREAQKELLMSGVVKPFAEGIGGMMKDGFGFLTGRDAAAAKWFCKGPGTHGPGGHVSGTVVANLNKCGKDSTDYFLGGKTIFFCKQPSSSFGTDCVSDKPVAADNDGGQTGGPAEVPASPEPLPGQTVGEDGKPTGKDLLERCASYADLAGKEGGAPYRDVFLPATQRLIKAYAHLENIKYKSQSSAAQCKMSDSPPNAPPPDGDKADAKAFQYGAADELKKVNAAVGGELQDVSNRIVSCVHPSQQGGTGSCRTIQGGINKVKTDLADGQKDENCSCTIGEECSKCDNWAKKIQTAFGDGEAANATYFSDERKVADAEHRTYSDGSTERKNAAVESLKKVMEGEKGWMPAGKKAIEASKEEIALAKGIIDSKKSTVANAQCAETDTICKAVKTELSDYETNVLGDEAGTKGIAKTVKTREDAQRALGEAHDRSKKTAEEVLTGEKLKVAFGYVDFAVTNTDKKPNGGYGTGFSGTVGLYHVEPQGHGKVKPEFDKAREGQKKPMREAIKADTYKGNCGRLADCKDMNDVAVLCSAENPKPCTDMVPVLEQVKGEKLIEAAGVWKKAFQDAGPAFETIAPKAAEVTGDFPAKRFKDPYDGELKKADGKINEVRGAKPAK